MSDSLYSGQRYRVLNILDKGVRETLEIVVDTSITAQRLVRTLEQIKAERLHIKRNRGRQKGEMTSQVSTDWREAQEYPNRIHPLR